MKVSVATKNAKRSVLNDGLFLMHIKNSYQSIRYESFHYWLHQNSYFQLNHRQLIRYKNKTILLLSHGIFAGLLRSSSTWTCILDDVNNFHCLGFAAS